MGKAMKTLCGNEKVKERWATTTIPEKLRTLAEDIRRESFTTVSRSTRQHEIASHVSDDFDLIVRGWLVGATDPLLTKLWDESCESTLLL